MGSDEGLSQTGGETMKQDYTPTELLICLAARLFEDRTTAFIGTGIPMLAAALARKLYTPHLVPIFEFGGVGSPLEYLPRAVGEARTFHRAVWAAGICEIMETSQRGLVEYGFLGAAQIDPYGNLNTTVIGPYNHPKVRLPGAGGGNDVGSLCWRTIILMKHERHRFVEKLDFLTTPGYLQGGRSREEAGLPHGSGPYRVVTNLAVLGFDEETKRMKLLALNPGVTVDQVVENTGFELLIPDSIEVNDPPTEEELRILREEIDPEGFYLETVSGRALDFVDHFCAVHRKKAVVAVQRDRTGQIVDVLACSAQEGACATECRTEILKGSIKNQR